LTPDNNACENAIRPFVPERKNRLFNKSPEGAISSCGMYSLIETARQNRFQPLEYLRTLFERCPRVVVCMQVNFGEFGVNPDFGDT
jgi:transposase